MRRIPPWPKPAGYNFHPGRKQVFLPNVKLTLLRTPFLAPKWAQFIVPLNFNKLDIRDYLFHTYNVSIRSVRSFIVFQPIARRARESRRNLPGKRKMARPVSIKKMTVELEKPFVWPEAPTDFEPWDRRRYDAFRKDQFGEEALERERAREIRVERLLNEEGTPSSEVPRTERNNPRGLGKQDGTRALEKQRGDMKKRAEEILSGKVKWGTRTQQLKSVASPTPSAGSGHEAQV